jgi:uncharacterized protein HemX
MKRLIILAVALILGLNVAVFSQQQQQAQQPQKPAVTEQKKAPADTMKKEVKKEVQEGKESQKGKEREEAGRVKLNSPDPTAGRGFFY